MNHVAADQLNAHLDRAWDLLSRGDLSGAHLSAQKSLELDEGSPEAHHVFGYVCAAEGRIDDALEHYKQAIDLDEGFVDAMLHAAEMLIHPLQDYQAALEMAQDAMDVAQTDDELAEALLIKFEALIHQEKPEDAIQVLRLLPEGPFENPHIVFMVGRAYFEVGNVEKAEVYLTQAVQLSPPHPDAFHAYATLLEAKGQPREALLAYLRCRQLDAFAPAPPWSLPPEQFQRRVQSAMDALPEMYKSHLDGVLVIVGDLPGIEAVADGVDPRMGILMDDEEQPDGKKRIRRIFIYQRNMERFAPGMMELENELSKYLCEELAQVLGTTSASENVPPS